LKAIEPLQSLLDSRDERANLRKKIALTGIPSVSLSLNVPGFPKSNTITQKFFYICLEDLNYFLKANRISVNHEGAIYQTDMAGDFFIAPFSATQITTIEIKQLCEQFEERHPLGRFLDVDLTDGTGDPVSSGKAKLCFFCRQKPADICRHEEAHDLNELRKFMFSKMEMFCTHHREAELSREISSLALKAILYEISLTPKPGLVDKLSNGSHTDMSFRTFIDSSAAISAYFADLVQAGFAFHANDLVKALPIVRNIGLRMETAMFSSTQNVNTQKGLIFLMGISLFALGYLFAGQEKFETEKFREIIKQICKDLIHKELEYPDPREKTHGEDIYCRYSVSGARGEAESGFPMVFEFGLPELLKYRELNEEALQKAFLSIAAHNNDTNIIYRSNLDVLKNFKILSGNALTHFNPESYRQLMDYCAKENISPGGSADLLALTIFVYSLITSGDTDKFTWWIKHDP
jgi:holo-ACP synthase / triphosphoribosyl-dephospho-CoA synthase